MERTKNGDINRVDSYAHRKKIGKLETELQKAKMALSIAKSNNAQLKRHIDDTRRNKLMNLEILYNLVSYFMVL